ncbi:MAG: hypothetical protein ACREQZ_09155 [Woeseiaceae bacterium]
MRRATRGCPDSDRCFAVESSTRVFNVCSNAANATAPSAYRINVVPMSLIE